MQRSLGRSLLAVLPFCQGRLVAQKPRASAYPSVVRTLGDEVRARRLDRGLTQAQLAADLQVDVWTVVNWEGNHTRPLPKNREAIYRLLADSKRGCNHHR